MPRINPLSLRRPEPAIAARSFTDPLQPEISLDLTLQVSGDVGSETKRDEIAGEYIARYVTGDAEYIQSGGQRGTAASSLLLPSANVIGASPVAMLVTTSLCVIIASLMVAEQAAGAPEPYTFEDWVAISERMPTAFHGVVAWVDDLKDEARSQRKNEPRASGAPSSDSPSATVPPVTPVSSSVAIA